MGDQKQYNREYQARNIVQKKVLFNRQSDADMELLNYVMLQENFSQYAKQLIRADMKEKGIPFEYNFDE